MELQSKPDFERAVERFEAWWRCEVLDRPPITIGVERDHPPRRPVADKTHATLRDRWMDHEYKLDRLEADLDGAVYLAETFPQYMPNVGPEVVATLFGCELEFSESSSWSIPSAASCRDVMATRPDLGSAYWRNLMAATDLSIARGQGKWITGVPDLHTNADLLAALRDPQELCVELIDDIDGVARACEYVTDFFREFFDDSWLRISSAGQPCTSWCPTLHAGRAYVLQCDFICMISPAMFERTILPSLRRETQLLDRSIYHLDGPDALRHLDTVLELPDLDGVQWVYGAGNEPAARWVDVYKRVQAAGKCMEVICTDTADARAVAEHVRPEGVWFCVGGRYTRQEAEDFLRWAEAWAAGKTA